jgi:hypothetical protein
MKEFVMVISWENLTKLSTHGFSYPLPFSLLENYLIHEANSI